jgi:hypothetical protein
MHWTIWPLRLDKKFIFIFILNFFGNLYLLHVELDWQTVYTIEFLKKKIICMWNYKGFGDKKSWKAHVDLAIMELFAVQLWEYESEIKIFLC